MTKAKKISFFVLLGLLIALIIVYFAVIAPMLNETEDTDKTPLAKPDLSIGEGVDKYTGTKISLYPTVSVQNVVSLKIENKNGSFEFINQNGTLVLNGYEDVTLNSSYMAYLRSYTLEPTTIDSEPIRNVTDMSPYGLDAGQVQASYEITFQDGTVQKTIRVNVGNLAQTTENTYYVGVEGRNVVYRMQNGVEASILQSVYDFVEPIIYISNTQSSSSASSSTISTQVNTFLISKHSSGGENVPILSLKKRSTLSDTAATFDIEYPVSTIADISYCTEIFEQLYKNFQGDKVVSLNPTEADFERYGLSQENDDLLFVSATHGYLNVPKLVFSELQSDGYFYAYSDYYDNTDMIVKIHADNLSFLKEENRAGVCWAATDTPLSGFYAYIYRDTEAGYPGIASLSIRTKTDSRKFTVNETLILDKNGKEKDGLSITDGTLTFTDDFDKDSDYQNEFRNFYKYLLYFPMPSRFTTVTPSRASAYQTEQNFLFELIAVDRDGAVERYAYYRIPNTTYAFRVESKGTALGSEITYTSTQILFDVTTEQLRIMENAYQKLVSGQHVDADKDLY